MIERVLRDPEPRRLLRTAGFLFVAFPGRLDAGGLLTNNRGKAA